MIVPLTRGKVAIVDEDDAKIVGQHRWWAEPRRRTWYAATKDETQPRRPKIYMHRLILAPPPGSDVDHVNGDGLDNRRSNIRAVSQGVNQRNRHKASSLSRTGVRGVSQARNGTFDIHAKAGNAKIRAYGFPTIEQAEAAVKEARQKLEEDQR